MKILEIFYYKNYFGFWLCFLKKVTYLKDETLQDGGSATCIAIFGFSLNKQRV
jgi:hypothetical protein